MCVASVVIITAPHQLWARPGDPVNPTVWLHCLVIRGRPPAAAIVTIRSDGLASREMTPWRGSGSIVTRHRRCCLWPSRRDGTRRAVSELSPGLVAITCRSRPGSDWTEDSVSREKNLCLIRLGSDWTEDSVSREKNLCLIRLS